MIDKLQDAARWLSRSAISRSALGLIIVLFLGLLTHAAIFIGIMMLLAMLTNITAYTDVRSIPQQAIQSLRSFAPVMIVFILACVIAIPTAFDVTTHGWLALKVVSLHLLVVLGVLLGRVAGGVDFNAALRWGFATLAVTTVLLLEEQIWHAGRLLFQAENVPLKFETNDTNRSFLTVSIGLSFILFAARSDRRTALVFAAAITMIAILWATSSESARLVVIVSLAALAIPERYMSHLFSVVVFSAIVLMLLGPFLYGSIFETWRASPLHDFMINTIGSRLAIWADSSALILDSQFLGRGLSVLETIAERRDLFAMPYGSYGWHPHSAGLQVTTDLGVPGMAWLALVLMQLRTFVLTRVKRYQSALIVMMTGFVMVSFVADGLWQTWWWFIASLIAMWAAFLCANPPSQSEYAS